MRSRTTVVAAFLAAVVAGVALTTPVAAQAGRFLTGSDIADGSIRSVDVADGSLRSRDIANGSLRKKDFPVGALPSDGAPGERGDVGPRGETGPRGDAGARGDTGPRGEAGPRGDTGARGETGAVGPRGDTGAAGPRGDTGAAGPAGAQGPQGPQGVEGPSGVVATVFQAGPATVPTATLAFIAPTATVTLGAGETLYVVSSAAMGTPTGTNGARNLELAVCYRGGGSALVRMGVGLNELTAAPSQQHLFTLSAAKDDLAAGQYDVGLCGSSVDAADWSTQGGGQTSVQVFETR